jgi:hypothetical protein
MTGQDLAAGGRGVEQGRHVTQPQITSNHSNAA